MLWDVAVWDTITKRVLGFLVHIAYTIGPFFVYVSPFLFVDTDFFVGV